MFGNTFEPGGMSHGFILLPEHGNNGTVPAGATNYLAYFNIGILASVVGFVFPRAGVLQNFYFRKSGTQPAGGSLVATVFLNNIATAMSVTVPAGDAGAKTFSDLVSRIAVAAGDSASYIKLVNNAATASCAIAAVSLEWEYLLDP